MPGSRAAGTDAVITFRRATDADVPAIVDLYASLSSQSARMRFFGEMPRASLEAAAELGGVQQVVAVVALDGAQVVGEARYLMHGDGEYEFGLVVADDRQCQGLGRRLFDLLRRDAAASGIERLHGVVRVDNVPMLRMLRAAGTAIVEPVEDMVVVAEVSCADGMPGWRAASAGRRVLVEFSSFWEAPGTTALRQAGFDVRQCLGPKRGTRQTCPLVLCGRCRLAEGADVVACLLPQDDWCCREVAEAHASHRPDRLAARSAAEWEAVAPRLKRR